MKKITGARNKYFASRFKRNVGLVSQIYRLWLPELSKLFKIFVVWPSPVVLRSNLPVLLKKKKTNKIYVCIIGCTEIFIERDFNLEARATLFLAKILLLNLNF